MFAAAAAGRKFTRSIRRKLLKRNELQDRRYSIETEYGDEGLHGADELAALAGQTANCSQPIEVLKTRHLPPPDRELDSSEHDCKAEGCEVVRINVSGLYFDIRLSLLDKHPQTLLGNPAKRRPYWDKARGEFFFDRHRPTFEAIFDYYQYGGKLRRPKHVSDDIFLDEVYFYEIEKTVIETYKVEEGYVEEDYIFPDKKWKKSIWVLFEYPEANTPAFLVGIVSVTVTLLSIVMFCLETLPAVRKFSETHCVAGEMPNFLDPFFIIEAACTAWFTIELVFRFIACPNRWMFLKDIRNGVDFFAIFPFYFTLGSVLVTMSCEGAKSSAALSFLRVIRLVRVFKLTKHSAGLQVLLLTFKASFGGLCLFLVALLVCMLVFSSTIYYAEVGQPSGNIESIPDAFWWSLITMCTVGYGDKYPTSVWGKLVGALCALAGVLTLAIPVPIITENFNKFYTHKTRRGSKI